jgi:fermentation-respiration switch protein FrsA (DUF1100 family)
MCSRWVGPVGSSIQGMSAAWIVPLLLLQPAAASQGTDVRFSNGAVRLAGTLTLPDKGPTAIPPPAIVLLGGSGPAPRAGQKQYADQLNALGLATLAVDKRGSGESGGDWSTAALDDLVADALAAVRYLQSRDDVDRAHIGVWGVSQAGWVIPALLAHSSDVSFAIVVTGGGSTPKEIELYGYRRALDRAWVTAADHQRAEALLQQYFRWLGTGDGEAALRLAMNGSHDETWFQALGLERVVPSAAMRPKWAWVANYDPVPDIRRIAVPILVVLGGSDPLGPADPAARAWRSALPENETRSQVIVVPGMGHAARTGAIHSGNDPLNPDYIAAVETFVATVLQR